MAKKLEVGNVYSAHCFVDGERFGVGDYYQFRIIKNDFIYEKRGDNWGRFEILLGIKLDVEYSPKLGGSQCFWFDDSGVHDSSKEFGGVRFELKRKIKHKCQSVNN